MKSTANRTRPKVMNGIVGLLEASRRGVAERADYGGSARAFQTFRLMAVREPGRSSRGSRARHHCLRMIFSKNRPHTLALTRPVGSGRCAKQARLLLTRTLLGLDGGDRRHVQDAAGGH